MSEAVHYLTWGSRTPEDVPHWECAPFSTPKPLYGLEQLARHADAQVVIVEGERNADAATQLFPALACVAWPGGRYDVDAVDWQPLAGRSAVLIPTADDSGRQVMARLAIVLAEAGVVLPIKGVNVEIIPLNSDAESPEFEAPEGWCLADAVRLGWTPESALRWAKRTRMTYDPPTLPPAPGAVEAAADTSSPGRPSSAPAEQPPVAGSDGAAPQEVPITHRQMVPSETSAEPAAAPPESPETSAAAEAIASIAPGSSAAPEPPTLGVVDGNTVRKPRKRLKADPQDQLPEKFSDDAYADRWSILSDGKWRYTPALKVWHQWDGVRWVEDEKNSLHHKMRLFLRESLAEAGELSGRQRRSIVTDERVRGVLRLAGADPRHATAREDWDALAYLGTPAGPVDLESGKLLEPDPAYLISRSTAAAPQAGPHPWWDRVVARVSRGDESMRAYIQRWCGYMLIGGPNIEEGFLFSFGLCASGKSKFIGTLENILGRGTAGYFRKCDKEVFTHSGDKNTNIGEKIARLRGAPLLTVSELEEGARWRESLLKDFTGRETVEGRALYQSTIEYSPSFRLLFSSNFKPALRSTGIEIKRRLHLLEFPGTIPEEEQVKDLPERLKTEFPAILAWMIEGALA